jgi:hypothetical protein
LGYCFESFVVVDTILERNWSPWKSCRRLGKIGRWAEERAGSSGGREVWPGQYNNNKNERALWKKEGRPPDMRDSDPGQ